MYLSKSDNPGYFSEDSPLSSLLEILVIVLTLAHGLNRSRLDFREHAALQEQCFPVRYGWLYIGPRSKITFISRRCRVWSRRPKKWEIISALEAKTTAADIQKHLQCGSSVNKQQEALLEAAKGMQHWLWQLSPQGGGPSHKLIECSHMIGEFHLEPSRYIKPHRNGEFTEVPLHFPKSPQITCVIVGLCPLLPQLFTSLLATPLHSFVHAHPVFFLSHLVLKTWNDL